MGYDVRRAALLTLSLCALLLAAALMPAAGLGSFPSVSGVSIENPEPAGPPAQQVDTPTPTEKTTSERTEAATTTTSTSTATETTSASATDDHDDQQGSAFFGSIGILGMLVAAAVVGWVGYMGLFAALALIAGPATAVAILPFGSTIRSLPNVTMATLIGLSGSLSEFARGFGAALTGITRALTGIGRLSIGIGSAMASILAVPAALGRGFSLGFTSMFGSLGGALGSLGSGASERSTSGEAVGPDTDARTESPLDPQAPEQTDDGPLSVTDAWDLLTDNLSIRNKHAKTPTEISERAIESGWPTEPVERLTDAFQEIRYGGRDATQTHIETARTAIEHLRDQWGEES